MYQTTTTKEIYMISGEKIKRIRLSRGLTQQQIADYCKCDKKYISFIESFKKRPSQELYEKIIEAVYTLDDRSKEEKKKGKQRKECDDVNNESELQTIATEVVRGTEKF
jgi:transcriptional regulator with XRE-family HTH domain